MEQVTTSKLLSANGSFSQSPATKRTPSSFFSLLSLSSFLTGLCPYYSLSVIATPFPRPVIRHFIFFMCPNHFFQKPLRLFHRPASRFCFFPPPFTVIFNAVSLLKYQHNKPAVIAAITTYASDTAPSLQAPASMSLHTVYLLVLEWPRIYCVPPKACRSRCRRTSSSPQGTKATANMPTESPAHGSTAR